MDGNYISLDFHNEYAKRMEEEHKRQNHRIDRCEKAIEETHNLALSVERLATSVQAMVEEQKDQGRRLDSLENRDGEMWRKVIGYAITAVVGIVVGYIFKQLGM